MALGHIVETDSPGPVNRNKCGVGSHALAWQRVVPFTELGKTKRGKA